MANNEEVQAVERLQAAHKRIVGELKKVIVGQEQVIEEMLIAVFARGHCLLVGVPGLAKTLLVSTLARTLSLSFKRIQFTPDLMPSDITGTEILADDPATGRRQFRFIKGPVFTHLLLADEINRTPPKTQAALLEAMQERKISAGGEEYKLEEPFFVLATQNPIEQEGTYPLPEAQLDRFIFNIFVDYPGWDEEIDIMKRVTGDTESNLETVLQREEIVALQKLVRQVPVAEHVFHYAAKLVRSTRPNDPEAPPFVREWLTYGAGPRASLFLILAGKARAVLHGRFHVSIQDIQAIARPVLRHRILLNFGARSEGQTPDKIVDKLLTTIPADERLYQNEQQAAHKDGIFDPVTLQKIGSLELIAREVVEGTRIGAHKSPLRGFSTEFAHHRQYVPGDPVRHVDWRVFARSERYYLKLYEAETDFTAHLLLDASSSMHYKSGAVSKLEYAKYLAASLAYLIVGQRDAVALGVFDSEVRNYLPPSSSQSVVNNISVELEKVSPRPRTNVGAVLQEFAGRISRRGFVILFSDLLDNLEGFMKGLDYLRYRGHNVIVMHTLDTAELTFPFDGTVKFKGLEVPDELLTRPRRIQEAYLAELNKFLKEDRRACDRSHVDYFLVDTSKPVDVVLSAALMAREQTIR